MKTKSVILCTVSFHDCSGISIILKNMISWVRIINGDVQNYSLTLSVNSLNALSAWMILVVNPAELYFLRIFSTPLIFLCDVNNWSIIHLSINIYQNENAPFIDGIYA